jgi:hypothetical protein
VALIEAKLGEKAPAAKPSLRLVKAPTPPPASMDPITRESHLKMIRHLRHRFGLQVLVDQATFGRAGLDHLEDQELADLHRDMYRAHEYLQEGISLFDAGMLKPPESEECWG